MSIAENVEPRSVVASFTHDIFIKGCQIFKPDGPGDVEIGTLYPEEKIRSLEECFEDFVLMIPPEPAPETKKTTELIRESGNNNSTTTDNGVSGNSNDAATAAAAATNSAVVKTVAPISAMC